ncbi:MAG: hypothetical protein U0401_07085 [Anaerolineae bacterium]
MKQPFGSILKLTFAPNGSWLNLGPGWAVLAGVLSAGALEFSFAAGLQLLALWLLVDPLLGTLWNLAVPQRLWQGLAPVVLPATPNNGFYLPYAQPDSLAGQGVVWLRRYGRWWREWYWPEHGDDCMTFLLGAGVALLISFALGPTLFQLTLLAIGLTVLAGQMPSNLSAGEGGRLQSVAQLLLPWIMGIVLRSNLTILGLLLVLCYWISYLGGLRMLGRHQRAEWLFWLGQVAAMLLLLALGQLPGGAGLGVMLAAQRLIHTKLNSPTDFLPKAQPYLVASVLIAGWSLGLLFNV